MEKIIRSVESWARGHLVGMFVFNVVIITMVLLNTAQYFKPFFYLGINLIFFVSLVLSVVFLGARVKALFLIAVVFLIFTAFLKLVRIDVWADRASIYFYQSFFIGLVILLISYDGKA